MKQHVMEMGVSNTRTNRSAAELVMAGIKEQILSHALNPGDQLPNEYELCELFNVSRGSLREAVKILATMGILELRPGIGTFVSKGNKGFVQESLFFSLFLTYPDVKDIAPLRRIIENDVIELNIDNYDQNQEERAQMQHSLAELSQIIETQQPHSVLVANDMQFHKYMASACKNGVIESIYRSLIDYIQHSMLESDRDQPPERVYSSHEKIVETVEHKRREDVAAAVDFSLAPWRHP